MLPFQGKPFFLKEETEGNEMESNEGEECYLKTNKRKKERKKERKKNIIMKRL